MRPQERWRALPEAARWALAYAGVLMGSAFVGLATGLGADNAVFLAGALAIAASATRIRLGGPRLKVVGRTLKGRAIREPMPPEERRAEIRQGVLLFLFGLALWAALGAITLGRAPG